MVNKTRIIGIDPGLRNMGWGIIEVAGNKLEYIACGKVCSDSKLSLALRLKELFFGLNKILEQYTPNEAAVEQTFVNKDAVATLKLGQARAVALLVPSLHNVIVAEYAPNKVKKAVVGVGHCEKQQVQMMVSMLLPRSKAASADAADALAIAICHAHYRIHNQKMANIYDR